MIGARRMIDDMFEVFIAGVEKGLGKKLSTQERETTYNIFRIAYELGYNQQDFELSVKETG
jgi:hypothetical protein